MLGNDLDVGLINCLNDGWGSDDVTVRDSISLGNEDIQESVVVGVRGSSAISGSDADYHYS